MSVISGIHDDHGAVTETVAGRTIVRNYGRPEREHGAVRNVVGLLEAAYGIIRVTGDDRVEYVDNAVSNQIPDSEGDGVYALSLSPQGRVETTMYVYNAGEQLLIFVPPGKAASLVEEWSGKVFMEDVAFEIATDDLAVFGVHGPQATEKIASVLNGAASPEEPLSFVRGSMADRGVTVVRTDSLTGEESYEVICAADDAKRVFETLLARGMNAAPIGYDAFETLALEAGTPLFETALEGEIPNVAGVRNALDFEKGCYVGQEVVSRVENRGRPSRRLIGLRPEAVPEHGAAVMNGDESVGRVTRAATSPTLDTPIALAYVEDGALDSDEFAVRVDGGDVSAPRTELPFVDSGEQSARLPSYPAE